MHSTILMINYHYQISHVYLEIFKSRHTKNVHLRLMRLSFWPARFLLALRFGRMDRLSSASSPQTSLFFLLLLTFPYPSLTPLTPYTSLRYGRAH